MFPVIVDPLPRKVEGSMMAVAYQYSVWQRPKDAGVWRAILIASTLLVAPAQAADLAVAPYFPEPAKPYVYVPPVTEPVIDYYLICLDIALGKPVPPEFVMVDCSAYNHLPVIPAQPDYNPASPS